MKKRINLETIIELNSFKEIIEYLIEQSYDVKEDNQHEKSYNTVGYSKAYGYYLVAKIVKKENKETDLDTLFLSAEKKVRTIFSRELESNNDTEEYNDRARCAVIDILHDIYSNKHGKYTVNDIEDFKALFKDKESVNMLVASVLATLNNKYINQLRDGKTTNVVWKRVYNDDGTFKEVYETVNLTTFDAPVTTCDDKEMTALDYATVKALQSENLDVIRRYTTSLSIDEPVERTEGVTKYLAKSIHKLTNKQQSYMKKYSDLGLSEESLKYIMEHSDLKSIEEQLYSQSSKKKYRDSIQKNFIKKHIYDENIEMEFDEDGNLVHISKRFNEKQDAISSILACKDNKSKLDKLVSYISNNDYTANLLSDIIYSLPANVYRPIVAYINTNEVSNKYVYITFKDVIKALEIAGGIR
ncbi:MAG: hypothetical protein RRZ84_02695 [Romboutsia sp.]